MLHKRQFARIIKMFPSRKQSPPFLTLALAIRIAQIVNPVPGPAAIRTFIRKRIIHVKD
jgi:hypothetical protein